MSCPVAPDPRALLAPCLLLLLLACEVGSPASADSGRILAQINLDRRDVGLEDLVLEPLLSELAADRATDLASEGSLSSSTRDLSRLGRRMLSRGYDAHTWSESSLSGPGEVETLLNTWRRQRHASWSESVLGNFEHLGVGFSQLDGEPLVVLLFALSEDTYFFRRARPLEDRAEVRRLLEEATNRVRRARGRQPLTGSTDLDEVAQAYARRMLEEGFYDHVAPDGQRLRQRLEAVGYRARIGAENLAKGLFEPAEVVDRWMDSRGHERTSSTPPSVTSVTA